MTGEPSALVAFVDGTALAEDAARDLWKRFSEYMGEHKGDIAGFAKSAGFVQISPEYRGGRAVLVAYTKEPPPKASEGANAKRGSIASGRGRRGARGGGKRR